MLVTGLLVWVVSLGCVFAQFGNLFEHLFKNQHAQEQNQIPEDSHWLEQQYDRLTCDNYLCEDSLACVKSKIDCPCKFPASELKCILPDKKNYLCISKPAGPGGDDCSTVEKAWRGEL